MRYRLYKYDGVIHICSERNWNQEMSKIEYKIISETTPLSLSNSVASQLNDGWRLHGSLLTVCTRGGNIKYSQAVIRNYKE